jgi:hypothetical protein
MLIPIPPPTYTLSPALRSLRPEELAVLEGSLEALSGQVATALVVGVGRALGRVVFELATPRGPMLLLDERSARPEHAYR